MLSCLEIVLLQEQKGFDVFKEGRGSSYSREKTHGGWYVARMKTSHHFRAGYKQRKVIRSVIKAKIMGLSTPGTVNLMAKYHISVSS